jgi:hypothetical protein
VSDREKKTDKSLNDCLERVIKREEENLDDCDNSDLPLTD